MSNHVVFSEIVAMEIIETIKSDAVALLLEHVSYSFRMPHFAKCPYKIENDGFVFTDYKKVYRCDESIDNILEVEPLKAIITDGQLQLKVPLLPGSKMMKVVKTTPVYEVDTTVEDFMLPLLQGDNTNCIQVFLSIIESIQARLVDGDPLDTLREELDSPEELVRRALMNHIQKID